MFENFGFEISKLFKDAETIRYDLRHPYVGSEHLLLAVLKNNNEVSKELKKYNINYTNFKKELVKIIGSASVPSSLNLYTPLLKRVIENATYDAKEENSQVTIRHLFLAMLEEGEGIALRILLLMDVDLEKIYNHFKKSKNGEIKLDFGTLLNATVSKDETVVCRDEEINKVIETLLRHKKNNPLLVGKAGVGKTAIVEELARRINNKQIPQKLENAKIIMLEMGNLVSGTKYRGEFEEKLTKIIDKATEDESIILFIDEIHSMVNAGAADGAVSAADILKPYLARGNIKVIGATTINEYNKYFDVTVSASMVSVGKPAPDIYLKAAEMLGLSPQNCVALEDSPNGIKSASSAGCVTVMVPDLDKPSNDIISLLHGVADGLSDVKRILRELEDCNIQ